MQQLYSIENLPAMQNTAVAIGLFDGVHIGHQAVIGSAVAAARAQGGQSVVFTFRQEDARPVGKQGAKRIMSEEKKHEVCEILGADVYLCPAFEEIMDWQAHTFFQEILLGRLDAQAICCGSDFRFGKGAAGTAEVLRRWCDEEGVSLLMADKVEADGGPVSSTRVRMLIAHGEMEQAARLLGREYSIDFPVVQGRRLGRTIGTPTINQEFPEDFVIPRYGVYATVAYADGQYYAGVTNVGVKPTVGSDRPLSETYILGYNGNLYGKRVTVSFLSFLRPEKKFPSVEELRRQIALDAHTAARVTLPWLRARG